jgi:hypothetical protein
MHAEEKLKLLADENNRGYTPFAEETLDPANQSRGDTKEGFYFGRYATLPWLGAIVCQALACLHWTCNSGLAAVAETTRTALAAKQRVQLTALLCTVGVKACICCSGAATAAHCIGCIH